MQIIEHFKQEISTGRLKAGDRLPAGREIAAEFGVSVATAAKVVGGLQAMGLVTALPGSGTVVSEPRPHQARVQGGPLLIRLASRGPVQPGEDTRVLSAEMTTAPQRSRPNSASGRSPRSCAGASPPAGMARRRR